VHRGLAAGPADGVEGAKERGLRPLLVHRAAADQHLAQTGPVDERRLPGRRGPLGGIRLLHVVHEVEPQCAGSPGVERGEDAGLTVGGPLRDLTEPRLPQHPHRELAALVHAPVLGGDRWLPDPLLQTLDALVVPLRDLASPRATGAPMTCLAWRPVPLLTLALLGAGCRRAEHRDAASTGAPDFRNPASAALTARAPATFRARFETGKGAFVIEVQRE